MQIQWYGQSCFKIQGKEVTIITDPFFDTTGLKLRKSTADITTMSHEQTSNIDAVSGDTFEITTPGEYEVKDVFIFGVPSYADDAKGKDNGENVIFRFDIEGMRIAHLGMLGHQLESRQLEKLSRIDVLLVPVGGHGVIDHAKAALVVSQLEPSIIVPMLYHVDELKEQRESVEKFCKEMGCVMGEPEEKLKITKKDLQQEDSRVVILQKS